METRRVKCGQGMTTKQGKERTPTDHHNTRTGLLLLLLGAKLILKLQLGVRNELSQFSIRMKLLQTILRQIILNLNIAPERTSDRVQRAPCSRPPLPLPSRIRYRTYELAAFGGVITS